MSRMPLVAILLLIAAAQAAPARESPSDRAVTTTVPPSKEEDESSSLTPVESGTFTIDFDVDLILTTDSRGEIFSEATDSPFGTTEEPLPESVVLQLELERAQTAQSEMPDSQTTEISETTTEKPRITETKTPTNKTTLGTPPNTTTTEPSKGKNLHSFFQDKLSTIGTANLVDEIVALKSEEDHFEAMGATMLPLTQLFGGEGQLVATPRTLPEVEESRTEAGLVWLANTEAFAIELTTLVPVQEDKEYSTAATTEETTELSSEPHSTITQSQVETTTETIETTTNAPRTTTSPAPVLLTTKHAILLGAQPDTTAPNVLETTTSFPTTTRAPETTIPTTNVPSISSAETTTRAPETTIPPTQVPRSSVHTTTTTRIPITKSAPTTATFAPRTTVIRDTTTPNAVSPTPEPRPIQTRAPRVERIFNSDGVEVLYGYSSVVRTNRS